MNGDFLTRLVARETGRATIVAPALPPPFLLDTEVPVEIETHDDDRPPTVPVVADRPAPVPDSGTGATAITEPPVVADLDRSSAAPSLPLAPPRPAPETGHAPAAAATPPRRAPSPPTISETVPRHNEAPPTEPSSAPDPAPPAQPEHRRLDHASAPPPAAAAPAAETRPPIATSPTAVDDRRAMAPAEPPSHPEPGRREPADDRRVRITIGRIEVRAPAPPSPSAPPGGFGSSPVPLGSTTSAATHDGRRVREPSRSLDDYVRERRARR